MSFLAESRIVFGVKYTVDLTRLDSATRKRVERVIAPRDARLALLFVKEDVAHWERASKGEGYDSLSQWAEHHLDHWAPRTKVPASKRTPREQAAVARDCFYSRRYNRSKLKVWKASAKRHNMTLTEWVERCLNHGAKVHR